MRGARAPSREALRFYLLVALTGTLAGLAAVAFHALLDGAAEVRTTLGAQVREMPWFMGSAPWSTWLLPMAIGAIMAGAAAWLVRRFAPEAAGSGIPQVVDALENGGPIRHRRLLAVKFFGGLLAIGSGLGLGREGPTIHLGAALAALVAARFPVAPAARGYLLMAGAGAGLAAAFNAPLAGIVFVTEEMRRQFDFSFRALQAVIVACLIATVLTDAIFGVGPVLELPAFHTPPVERLWTFLVLGVVIGLYAWLFNRSILKGLEGLGRIPGPAWLPAALVGALAGGLLPWLPELTGGGDQIILVQIGSSPAIGWLVLLIVGRTLLLVLSYGSGVPGGLFAPMLALGTLVGLAFGNLLPPELDGAEVPAGVFAVAAMGALFAATVRAPLTGIIVVVEMTGDYELILPIMLTSLTATFTAESLGGRPIYHLLLERTRGS